MRPRKDEFGLRLAAKAADRGKAAREQWPVFEERLTELGYSPRAIAHAFRTLSGPGTVAEALDALKGASRPESHPIALSFEVADTAGPSPPSHGVTITSVVRDQLGIRVNYESVPPPTSRPHGPQAAARDDLGNAYDKLGGHFGHAHDGWRGGFTLPLPPPAATTLRIRITWDTPGLLIWDRPAHEVRVSLPG
jgi:hypothetical protein